MRTDRALLVYFGVPWCMASVRQLLGTAVTCETQVRKLDMLGSLVYRFQGYTRAGFILKQVS